MKIKKGGFNLYGAYSNSYLLRNLKENNIKLYHKFDDNGSSQSPVTNIFYILNNVRDLVPK